MELKNNTLMIGLGNCGCKIAKQFADIGYNALFANGSSQDLKVLGNIPGVYKLKGFDGFGGHRDRALACLSINEEFTDALEDVEQDLIFVIYAAGGSTGSGLATIVAQYLNDVYGDEKLICMVCVLPADTEAINHHKNAYEAIQELLQLNFLGASFFLDNNTSDHKRINKKFVTLLDTFLDDDSWSDENNFDCAERIEMLSESGSMLLALSEGDSTDQLLKGGIFAPMQADKVCGYICVIHSDKYDISVEELVSEVGRPLNIYEGYGASGSLVAVSGCSFPIDHVTALGKIAIEGQKERRVNYESAKVMALPSLKFESTDAVKGDTTDDNSGLSGRDMLLSLRQKKLKAQQQTQDAEVN